MLTISNFMRDFYYKLYEVAPEEVKRDITKQERVVKHTLFMIMGQQEQFHARDAAHFQERFHVRIDQMASDYQTWKRGGCKAYAKPKQYVSGRVAGASKKAFDQVLNTYILQYKARTSNIKEEAAPSKAPIEESQERYVEAPKEDLLREIG